MIVCRDPFLGSAVDVTACRKHMSTKKRWAPQPTFSDLITRPETHSRKCSRMCRAPFFCGLAARTLFRDSGEVLWQIIVPELFQYWSHTVPVLHQFCCFSTVSVLFQYCFSAVPILFLYCTSAAPVLFQCCPNTVPVVFQ